MFRGVAFLEPEETDDLVEELRDVVEKTLSAAAKRGEEPDLVEEKLHEDIAAFVYDALRRRPMILPVVVEV
jgi:ribonuclease J